MATGIPLASGRAKTARSKANGNNSHHPSIEITLSYEGKKSESVILASPPAELVRDNNEGVEGDAPNRLYFGENLSVLAALLNDPNVRGKVRLVYIDPPYATKSVFQSRQQADAYSDLLEGAHYIEFLRERLILLRELLADDGSIYVHLDDNMAFLAKAVMDEVFGASNFRNWITRKKCNPKNYTRKTFGNVSDYILFYTKSDNYVWHRPVEAWTAQRADKEYQYTDEKTGRRYKKVPIHAPGVRNGETGQPWRGMMPPPGKHWQYRPSTLDEMDARGEIYWSPNGNPRRKVFLDESDGVPVQDIWLDFRDAHNQNIHVTGYPTEKNPALLQQIIEASSNEGDIVLDCFAGSGTTLAAAHAIDRHWIGIDNSPEALRVILQRFSNGLEPMGDFVTKPPLHSDELDLFAGGVEVKTVSNGNGHHAPIRDFEMWKTEKSLGAKYCK
jgi:adenine-specific DNA-methyltransferase